MAKPESTKNLLLVGMGVAAAAAALYFLTKGKSAPRFAIGRRVVFIGGPGLGSFVVTDILDTASGWAYRLNPNTFGIVAESRLMADPADVCPPGTMRDANGITCVNICSALEYWDPVQGRCLLL